MKLAYLLVRFESETQAKTDYDTMFIIERLDEAKEYVDSIFNRIADNHEEFVGQVVKVITRNLSEKDLEDLHVDLNDYKTWRYIGDDSLEKYIVEYEIKK